MTPKELREAAQRACDFSRRIIGVIKNHGEELRKYDVVGDNVICAEYILATVRDDDDELITMEWVLGFNINEITIGLKQIHFLPHDMLIEYRGRKRRQFRQLCEGLGIQLKETT